VLKLFLALMDSNFEGKQGLYEETTKKSHKQHFSNVKHGCLCLIR